VSRVITIVQKAKVVDRKLNYEESIHNPILEMDLNQKLHGHVKDVVEKDKFIKSKEFVVNNIEFFTNSTLKKLIYPQDNKDKIENKDKISIARMFLEGKSLNFVLLKWGAHYSRAQIENVKKELIKDKKLSSKGGVK
jgi:hypothetical protein